MKFIEKVRNLEKIEIPVFGSDYDYLVDNFVITDSIVDSSDLAMLNNELNHAELLIVQVIEDSTIEYTHIVQDSLGFYYAVIIALETLGNEVPVTFL